MFFYSVRGRSDDGNIGPEIDFFFLLCMKLMFCDFVIEYTTLDVNNSFTNHRRDERRTRKSQEGLACYVI